MYGIICKLSDIASRLLVVIALEFPHSSFAEFLVRRAVVFYSNSIAVSAKNAEYLRRERNYPTTVKNTHAKKKKEGWDIEARKSMQNPSLLSRTITPTPLCIEGRKEQNLFDKTYEWKKEKVLHPFQRVLERSIRAIVCVWVSTCL